MFLAIVITVAQFLGVLSSISALFTARTSQGAIAWIVSLVTFPYLAVPAYWIFGRTRFNGYVQSRKAVDAQLKDRVGELRTSLERWRHPFSDEARGLEAAESIAKIPFTFGNTVELLIDGPAAFERMFDAIERARRYVLIQFYIVRADRFGQELKELLLATAARGVRVYFLLDEIGSYRLPLSFVRELRLGGVRIHPFSSTRGRRNRFQLNFRNHRKVLVIDGVDGYVGGLNIGEEYLGLNEKFGLWRDTHVRLRGPALVGLQLPFVEDWHWATGEHLDLDWAACIHAATSGVASVDSDDSTALVLPSGPADEYPTAGLMIQNAIHSARKRLWIASPYFVPDEAVQDALVLAAMRGVDVRILIPDRPDHILVYLSAFAFVGAMLRGGVKIYRYLPAFLHEKVFLVDDEVAGVGTVNLDNRSFRLNFEITALIIAGNFAQNVHRMFVDDFARSRQMTVEEVDRMPLWLRGASRLAYLFAPIQ